MDRYFDAFRLRPTTGARRLMFRIPKTFLGTTMRASDYCVEDGGASPLLKAGGREHIVLEFSFGG